MSLKDTVRINAICRSSSATLKLDFKSSALASGADTSFILGFAPAVNTSKGGVYIINVSGALKGDEDSYNDTASTLLNIHPLPATHFTINFLSSKKYRLHALDSTLKNYTWKISDTTTDSGFVIDHAFKTTGVYTISLATTNKYGCVDSWSHTLSPLVTGVAIENENPTMKIRTNPNPFISYTNIYYTLPVAEQVSIEVYDLTGHHVATIANEINSAGEHSIPFYPEQYHLAHGMYLLKCRVDDTIQVKQIMYGE